MGLKHLTLFGVVSIADLSVFFSFLFCPACTRTGARWQALSSQSLHQDGCCPGAAATMDVCFHHYWNSRSLR